MPHQQSGQGNALQGVESYFTDVEHIRSIFQELLSANFLRKPMLNVYGLGGVGKSSLLRIFLLDCKKARVPVALASGEECKSAVEILSSWADDLKVDGVKLSKFTKTYQQYRTIQARVNEEARKLQDMRGRASEMLGKATTKTAETAAGIAIGGAVGSLIPGIGTIVGALGGAVVGTTAEELMDFLDSFLSKAAIDLLLDPAKKLTDDFLNDIARATRKRRIVLLLDTFEQMTGLNEWSRRLAQQLQRIDVLLVIAGRDMVNWDRKWDGWLALTNVQKLEPMTHQIMRDLVRNYYATQVGGEPNPEQVEKIIHFARGLPIAVTTAVRLWVKYHMDFDEAKGEAIHELVKRLIEGIPTEIIPALTASATVRYFNKEILRAVMDQTEVNVVYDELRHFPFVLSSKEGLRLHDTVREILEDSLEMDDGQHYRDLHEHAALYFEKNLEKIIGEEADRAKLEMLYHRILANETIGIQLFHRMAEELVRYRLINSLRALMNDVNTYPLKQESSKLWRAYYNARLAHLETNLASAEKIYQSIGENIHAHPQLRAYALCDWGEIWTRYERLSQRGGIEKAIDILELSRKFASEFDSKLIFVLQYLRIIYIFKGDWDKALPLVEQQRQFFQESGDRYGVIFAYSIKKAIYGLLGDWKEALTAHTRGLQELSSLSGPSFLQVRLKGFYSWVLVWSGRYHEAEEGLRESLSLLRETGNIDLVAALTQDLGFASGMQRKYSEAANYFVEGMKEVEHLGQEYIRLKGIGLGFWGAVLTLQGEWSKAEYYLKESLKIKREVQDSIGIPETLNWLGEFYEIQQNWSEAEAYYHQTLDLREVNRPYFKCGALIGLARVKYRQGDHKAISPLLVEAEQLAQLNEYNDYLASIRLFQGHIAWNTRTPDSKIDFDSALHHFQQAIIFSLRFNRFLLDEVLSGRSAGTSLWAIIPYSLKQGAEGRRMLASLRDWWRTGTNNTGEQRLTTISPLDEGITLQDAERITRRREPGDGSPQFTVIEQIDRADSGTDSPL